MRTNLIKYVQETNNEYKFLFTSIKGKQFIYENRYDRLGSLSERIFNASLELSSVERRLFVMIAVYFKYYYYHIGYWSEIRLKYRDCPACSYMANKIVDTIPYECGSTCPVEEFCAQIVKAESHANQQKERIKNVIRRQIALHELRERILAYARSNGWRTLYLYLPRIK